MVAGPGLGESCGDPPCCSDEEVACTTSGPNQLDVRKILREGVAYEERSPAVTKQRAQRRAAKMIRELRSLGYRVEPVLPPASALA